MLQSLPSEHKLWPMPATWLGTALNTLARTSASRVYANSVRPGPGLLMANLPEPGPRLVKHRLEAKCPRLDQCWSRLGPGITLVSWRGTGLAYHRRRLGKPLAKAWQITGPDLANPWYNQVSWLGPGMDQCLVCTYLGFGDLNWEYIPIVALIVLAAPFCHHL